MLISFFIYATLYAVLCNWCQILFFTKALVKPKTGISILHDSWIAETVKRKTGITLKRIIIFENPTLFGMMPGIPLHPEMILSRGLYETLNRDELEWVILHEGAHCKFWHVIKCAAVQVLILIMGWLLSASLHIPFLLVPIYSILFSFLAIQGMMYFEWEADSFSISHVKNPQGAITAQQTFIVNRTGVTAWFYDERNVFRKLLFWNILPSQRIEMARWRMAMGS